MPLLSPLTKIALCAAMGTLTMATAVGPATAAPSHDGHHPLYKGRVIAKTGLFVRTAPRLDAPVVGSLAPGKIVHIKCKAVGASVDGNPRWYRLPGKGWVAAARYIKNIGPAPHWCR